MPPLTVPLVLSALQGMDFAFFSTSLDESTAEEFVGTTPRSVLFEVSFLAACPGADVSTVSLYPAEAEVLFPPCTGLNLWLGANDASGADPPGRSSFGSRAGQARVTVVPAAAH